MSKPCNIAEPLMCELQDLVFHEYIKNAYLKMWSLTGEFTPHEDNRERLQDIANIAELGLITTEVSEAIEAVRHGDWQHVPEELADIIIRVMNFASRHYINLTKAVLDKHEKNLERAKLHGKKV